MKRKPLQAEHFHAGRKTACVDIISLLGDYIRRISIYLHELTNLIGRMSVSQTLLVGKFARTQMRPHYQKLYRVVYYARLSAREPRFPLAHGHRLRAYAAHLPPGLRSIRLGHLHRRIHQSRAHLRAKARRKPPHPLVVLTAVIACRARLDGLLQIHAVDLRVGTSPPPPSSGHSLGKRPIHGRLFHLDLHGQQ